MCCHSVKCHPHSCHSRLSPSVRSAIREARAPSRQPMFSAITQGRRAERVLPLVHSLSGVNLNPTKISLVYAYFAP